MGLATEDQETIVQFSRNGDEATIWTSDSTIMTRLDKLVEKSGRYKVKNVDKINGDIVSKEYILDNKSLISFRADKIRQNLTDEQRARVVERLRQGRRQE